MLPVVERDTSPRATSMMYCSAIATCHEAREFGRAREWTHALGAWLDSLPRLGGAYFGNCRIYRAYLMCLRGSWQEALEEVAFVCDDLSGNYGQLVAGHAHYQLAEIHRLLGNPEAEASYRQAAELGGPTQPGLSLLRLTQGEVDKAVLGIRRALAETPAQLDRLDLLTAAVTIMLAAGDIDAARQATAELAGIAAVYTQLACRPSSPPPAARSLSAREIPPQPCHCSEVRPGAGVRSTSLTRWQRCRSSLAWRVGRLATRTPLRLSSSRRDQPSPALAPALICNGSRSCCALPRRPAP